MILKSKILFIAPFAFKLQILCSIIIDNVGIHESGICGNVSHQSSTCKAIPIKYSSSCSAFFFASIQSSPILPLQKINNSKSYECAFLSRCMLFRSVIVLIALDPNGGMVGLLLIKKRFEQPCSPSVVAYSARLGAISRAKTKHPSNFQLPKTPTVLKRFQAVYIPQRVVCPKKSTEIYSLFVGTGVG